MEKMEGLEGLAYQTRRKIQNVKNSIEAKEDLKEIEKKYFNTVRKRETFFKANAVYFTEAELEYLDYKKDKSVGTDKLTQNFEAENETSKSVSKNKLIENTNEINNSDISKQVSTDKLTNTNKDEIAEDKSVGTDELTTNNTVEVETSKQVSTNQPIEISNIEVGKIVSSDLLNNYFSNKENAEALIKIIETYKNNHNAEFTIIGNGEINIPSEVLMMKNDGTMSIKTNMSQYQKIRELAFKNNVGIANFMNFVVWEFLKRHS